MSDTVKSLIELRDIATVREKAIELQGQILTAQGIALETRAREDSLVAKISDLKEQIAQYEKFDSEKVTYELYDIGSGAFAYVRKLDAQPPEPPHWLCAKCFNEHRKSILQYQGRTNTGRDSIYTCPTCKSGFQVSWARTPEKIAEMMRGAGS